MNFELKSLDLAGAAAERADALVIVVTEADAKARGKASDAVSRHLREAVTAADFDAKAGKLLQLYRVSGVVSRRVVLAGAGEGTVKHVRQAVQAAISGIKSAAVKRVCVVFAADPGDAALQVAIAAMADASYVYTTTKSKAEGRRIERVLLGVPDAASRKAAFERGSATVMGVEFAKEWGNRPANHATPSLLADAARSLGKLPKVKCEVLGPKEVARLGMGSFMAVAKGSEEQLRFIVLRYDGGRKTDAPVVLVGKGITFDTGGISIKPAPEMDEMKFDMCGAASVLGVFRSLAELRPAINVVGLIPACENMPDGRAVKPGDVVTSMSGQTIEILNTDAEGRLVLCDALTYAEQFKPAAVVDIATLTGACVVALGGVRSGLFSPSDPLAAALLAAGDAVCDPCWRMPLDDEYAEGLKTNFADVANIAGRAAGAVTAAKFLQRFAGSFAWAHLDIAGTAWKSGAAKGSTGRPVALLLEYLLSGATASAPAARPTRSKSKAAGGK